jgi:hydroxyacylglutathione hydrolase
LSGSRELEQETGAPIYCSDEGGTDWQYEFAHHGLHDGDVLMVGNIKFEVWHTPGHTPEHICFLVTDTPASDKPIMFFSGDFVFVGDVGRPDLLERAAGYGGTMELGAKQLFRSLHRFKTLPDYIQLHPAHGAGSACGKALGAIPSSTVGYEKLVNWALTFGEDSKNENDFVEAILSDQPEPPRYFAMMKHLNKVARPLSCNVSIPAKLSPIQVANAVEQNVPVLDTRHRTRYAVQHIKSSVNVMNNNALSTRAGWMIGYDKPFILVAEKSELMDVARRLMRVGLDNIQGYLDADDLGSIPAEQLDSYQTISIDVLASQRALNNLAILDVRTMAEYNAGHIPGAVHIHFGYLTEHLNDLSKDNRIAVVCQSGDRSGIALSVLKRAGFTNVVNVEGGMNSWDSAALQTTTA